jgi:hypothetical protein
MDSTQVKKCGMLANNKLLVLIIKSQLKKKSAKVEARAGMKCCAVKSALKVAGKVFIKQLVRLDK